MKIYLFIYLSENDMGHILSLFVFITLTGFLLSLIINKKNETLHSGIVLVTSGLLNIISFVFIIFWAISGTGALHLKQWVLYRNPGYQFSIDFYFDHITAVFLVVGNLLTFLITIYSRYYLHREAGYKRFFNTILFFYLGYNITILSGNFETFFTGWEILGVSSFLLIGYYRERYLPVRNALKVYSIYRIGDIALLLVMWMSHHLWHHNITFAEFNNINLVNDGVANHFGMGLFISLMILLAAVMKSAQFPFSSWLPRAMEGPTPSSAIFYSSLSVHIGVFLLLRTYPFWENQQLFRWFVGILGITTTIVATLTGNVQVTVKSLIAYSSIAQIGLIFIEIALGLETIALTHFAGNALLRTYQLLISPSAVTYLIREQFYTVLPFTKKRKGFWRKVFNSIYILSVKEWNMDTYQFRYLWSPFKKVGMYFSFINTKFTAFFIVPFHVLCWILLINGYFEGNTVSHISALIALILVLRSFIERNNPIYSFALIAFSHFWLALAIFDNEPFSLSHGFVYLSGVLISVVIGGMLLTVLKRKESAFDLNGFYGHVYKHKWLGFCFLLTCLGLAGFPISPTFIGEDLIFGHLESNQIYLVFLFAITLIFCGLSVIRIYTRLFLGPPTGGYLTRANRSS